MLTFLATVGFLSWIAFGYWRWCANTRKLQLIEQAYAEWEAKKLQFASVRAERIMADAATRGYKRTEEAFVYARDMVLAEMKDANPWSTARHRLRYKVNA